jgi:hypothetical protein
MVGFTSSACHSPKIFKPERPPQTTSSTQNEGSTCLGGRISAVTKSLRYLSNRHICQ